MSQSLKYITPTLLLLGLTMPTMAQQNNDPTFNGFAKLVHCNMGSTVICMGEHCAVVSTGGLGPDLNMWISSRKSGPLPPVISEVATPLRSLSKKSRQPP